MLQAVVGHSVVERKEIKESETRQIPVYTYSSTN